MSPLPRQRAVFISDVHLGSRHCHAAELAAFLRGVDAGQSGRFQLAEILRLVQSA